MTRHLVAFLFLITFLSLKPAAQLSFKGKADSFSLPGNIGLLPQNFYNQHKGFVCKKEDQIQKATGLNLFIRLGSKNYVDYLERKPNAIRP